MSERIEAARAVLNQHNGTFTETNARADAVLAAADAVDPLRTKPDNRDALAFDLYELLDEDDATTVIDMLWKYGYLTTREVSP